MQFDGKVVWITGASSGIGAALAREWARLGANVVLSGRDEARLEAVASTLPTESLTLPFDVRDDAVMADATSKAIEWKDGIDIAVANAGVSQRSRALKTDMQVYRDIIAIDLVQQIAFTQGLIGHMASRSTGNLVFVSSVAGKVGVPMRTAYSAAKFGLAGYADALRGELSQQGIGVHVVYPGSVATEVSRNSLTADGTPRGFSDKAIENGLDVDLAAREMIEAIAAGEREIIVAEGFEKQMGEARRTPDALFDQVAAMVASGYMEKLEAES